jgi:hypothetical protein
MAGWSLLSACNTVVSDLPLLKSIDGQNPVILGPENLQSAVVLKLPCYEPSVAIAISGRTLFTGESAGKVTEKNSVSGFAIGQDGMKNQLSWKINSEVQPLKIYSSANESAVILGPSMSLGHAAMIRMVSRANSPTQKVVNTPAELAINSYAEFGHQQYLAGPYDANVFSYTSSGMWMPLKFKLNAPAAMSAHKNGVYVIEANSIDFGDENLAFVNNTEIKRTFSGSERGQGFVELAVTSDGQTVALTEVKSNSMVLVNAQTMSFESRLSLGDVPRGVANYGKCVVTGLIAKGQLVFVDVSNAKAPKEVARWTVDKESPMFRGGQITVDEQSGTVYWRRIRDVSSCNATPEPGVIAVKDIGGDTRKLCGL